MKEKIEPKTVATERGEKHRRWVFLRRKIVSAIEREGERESGAEKSRGGEMFMTLVYISNLLYKTVSTPCYLQLAPKVLFCR